MAWLPISATVPQYVDANGDPASGYVLKAYSDGTSTNINFATDDTGGTEVSSIALDSNGNPSVTGSVVIPHIQEKFKLALYPTQTAADADSGAIWTVDDITPPDLTDTDTDELVKVSSNDTTGGYLNGKLIAGANVSLTEGSDGGNETLSIGLDTSFQDGHLFGLGTSRETINDILIATGSCVDSTNAFSMDLTTAITKQIDANWAEGDDAGGFPTALTVTVSTWYHLYLIAKADGTIDAGFDTVFGNPTNLMSDASAYTYYRYIGSYLTDSGTATTIISYHQYDDWIYWDSQSLDETGNTSLTETLTTLTVPPIGVMANIIAELSYVGGACNTTVYPTDLTEPTSGGTYKTFKVSSNAQFNASTFLIRADTSMQIAHESDNGSQDIDIWTIGWYYKR